MVKVVVYRGFGTNFDIVNLFNVLVGQYEGKVRDLLDNSEYSVCYMCVFVQYSC